MTRIEWVQDSSEPMSVPMDLRPLLAEARKQSKRIVVSITPVYARRSLNQNALFHAKVNEIAAMSGVDRDVVKKMIKVFATGRGYPMVMGDDGLPLIKDGEPLPKPTEEATVEEMEMLIDATFEWAFANGFYIQEKI